MTQRRQQRSAPWVLEFEPHIYEDRYADLAGFNVEQLREHYCDFGINEGRIPNSLSNREDFANMAATRGSVLELGPFTNPVVHHQNAQYADVLNTEQLRARAVTLGLDPETVPNIDWVVEPRDLESIGTRFQSVISSHVVEHQPDLVGHLQQVGRIMSPGGSYFVIIPDLRYCFDHFQVPSTLAKVIDRYQTQAAVHPLESLIEHRAMTTHNDPNRHWAGDHGPERESLLDGVRRALAEHDAAKGDYIDVHSWFFTPLTWSSLISDLRELRLIPFQITRVYPTRRGQNEFWTILEYQE